MQEQNEEESTSWPLGSVSRVMERRKKKRKHKRVNLLNCSVPAVSKLEIHQP